MKSVFPEFCGWQIICGQIGLGGIDAWYQLLAHPMVNLWTRWFATPRWIPRIKSQPWLKKNNPTTTKKPCPCVPCYSHANFAAFRGGLLQFQVPEGCLEGPCSLGPERLALCHNDKIDVVTDVISTKNCSKIFQRLIPWYPLVNSQIAIEHGPVEIVSFPMKNGDFPIFSIVFYMFTRPGNLKRRSTNVAAACQLPLRQRRCLRRRCPAGRNTRPAACGSCRGRRWESKVPNQPRSRRKSRTPWEKLGKSWEATMTFW